MVMSLKRVTKGYLAPSVLVFNGLGMSSVEGLL